MILKKISRKNIILDKFYSFFINIYSKFNQTSCDPNFEKSKLYLKVRPYTMASSRRLANVYQLSKLVETHKLEGAFVECGVWKGGCIAVMAYVAKKVNSNRKIWLFDSFEGLPEPNKKDGAKALEYAQGRSSGKLEPINQCVGPLDDVKEIFFSILKIDENNIVIRKGWFQDTLPIAKNEIGPIAILRVDGDWYESTKCCLENLYDNVISNGYVIIDDYSHWEGCKKAVEEFFEDRNIKVKLNKIDYTGRFFQKL